VLYTGADDRMWFADAWAGYLHFESVAHPLSVSPAWIGHRRKVPVIKIECQLHALGQVVPVSPALKCWRVYNH
jgi:hypothetical protein